MVVSLSLSIPQWTTISTNTLSLYQLPAGHTWDLTGTLLLRDYGTYLGANSNTLLLLGNVFYGARISTATPYYVSDLSGDTYAFSMSVQPAPMTVTPSNVVTLYQYETTNLPITITPTATPSATFTADLATTTYTATLSTGAFVFNPYITPVLPSNLTLSTNGLGVATISGTPRIVRTTPTAYTYHATDSYGRVMTQPVTLTVQRPRFQYASVSGGSVADQALFMTLSYGETNYFRFSMSPSALSVTATPLPTGMTLSFTPGQPFLDFVGIPSRFSDSGMVSTIVASNANFSSNTTANFTYNPAVELCNVPLTAQAYSNVTTTFYTAQAIPQTGNPEEPVSSWSLSYNTLSATLFTNIYSFNTLTVAGTVSSTVPVDLTVNIPGASFTRRTTLVPIADSVTFQFPGALSVSLTQGGFFTSSNLLQASAASGQPLTYSVVDLADLQNAQLFLFPSGLIQGTPLTLTPLTTVSMIATTPQGVSQSKAFRFEVESDAITFDPSRNFINLSARFIQNRPIEYDYTLEERTYRATTDLGNAVRQFQVTSNLTNTGLLLDRQTLKGIPLQTLSGDVSLNAVVGTLVSTLVRPYLVESDRLVVAQPTQTDFVLSSGESQSVPILAYLYSGAAISEFSLSGAVAGVSVSPGGLLSLDGGTLGGPRTFTVAATTYGGNSVTRDFTLTVNAGTFAAPTATSALLPPGTSLSAYTDPLTTLTLSGGASLSFSGSGQIYTLSNVNAAVYPPELVVFQSSTPNLKYPVRVASDTVQASLNYSNARWIQYVQIEPIVVSATSPNGSQLSYVCPYLPPGLTWSPLSRTIQGAPTGLTVDETFTVWVSDGYTTTALTFRYAVRVPAYLRGFTSPAAFTQYVRQRALVNGAQHALGRTAFLPDPLIATQGGEYPPDIQRPDYACIEGSVYYF